MAVTAQIDAVSVNGSDTARQYDIARPAIAVSARSLTKRYLLRRSWWRSLTRPFPGAKNTVLDAVDLDVREGEMFGILGLNGAGKTTLLKILATLILPDEGTATVAGYDIVANARDVRANLALVTADERSLNWRLSAAENLRLFASLHALPGRHARSLTARLLDTVGLRDSNEKIVGTFSSGMRQRLLLARALISNPRVLLLDEPTRSLDPVAAHEFRQLLRGLADRERMTIIVATHNPDEAFTYCDRVAVLNRGNVAAIGRAIDLAARFGRERYRVWTSDRHHRCFVTLERRGLVQEVAYPEEPGAGQIVEFAIIGGHDTAADVLRRIVESGADVMRFERVALPLSTLIARIVESHAANTGRERRHA